MIEFRKISKKYHYDEFSVFHDFSLIVPSGVATVMFDVQSGKTTLCKLFLGLEKLDGGEILWDGQVVSPQLLRDRRVSYLGEDALLFDGKTALYNVAYPLLVAKVKKRDAQIAAREALGEMGVEQSTALRKVKSLSAEEAAKVVLARLLVKRPKLVVLDEFWQSRPFCVDETLAVARRIGADVLVLTAYPRFAKGQTQVVFGGDVVYEGDESGAAKALEQVLWLNEKEV